MTLRTINREELRGKRVLLRVDLDVPVTEWEVTGGWVRLRSARRTIKTLQAAGARIVVIAHRGRPKGVDLSLTLRPVVSELANGLDEGTVTFVPPDVHDRLVAKTHAMANGDVVVLENLRFHLGEEKNDDAFAAQLAALGDVYMNDAFATCHRSHASVVGVTKHLPSYAGPGLLHEMEGLAPVMDRARKPFVAIVGGKKISSKLHAMRALMEEADRFFVGGAIATTFFVAEGRPVGRSMYEQDDVAAANELRKLASISLPVDVLVKSLSGSYRVATTHDVADDEAIVDIGPAAIKTMHAAVRGAQTIVWNGPMGVVEDAPSCVGSDAVAHMLAECSRGAAYGCVGGGDTVGLLEELKIADFVDHVSTGGGAMLEYLGHRPLPGLEALRTSL